MELPPRTSFMGYQSNLLKQLRADVAHFQKLLSALEAATPRNRSRIAYAKDELSQAVVRLARAELRSGDREL